MTKHKLVPMTVAVDLNLYEDIKSLSERFINPKSLKPYGISSVVRVIVDIGLTSLHELSDTSLLEYVSDGPKGGVGRWPLSQDVVKMSVLLPREHVLKINSMIDDSLSKIVGTTTVIRFIVATYIGEVKESDLYTRIPESHKQHMIESNLSPAKLRAAYRKSL